MKVVDKGQCSASSVVLVAGATGFVGANIVLDLAQHGHKVIAFDLQPPPSIVTEYWQEAGGEIALEVGSITDAKCLENLARRYAPTAVISAAAVTAVDEVSERHLADRLFEVNLVGTVRLLEVARRLAVRRFVYISSAGLYGSTNPSLALSESSPINPASLYMLTKEVSERLCLQWANLYGLDIVIGRLGQPYGPMERNTGARTVLSPIYQLGRAALTNRIAKVPLPDYTCDWTYVMDLATAIRLLVEADGLPHRLYNLSNGHVHRVSDIMGTLNTLIPDAAFEWVPADGDAGVDTSSDPRRGPLDNSRLRQDLGFAPAYDLEAGLRASLPWWRAMIQSENSIAESHASAKCGS